jgi:hypothetical protein
MSEPGGIFESPGRWGLLPDRPDGVPLAARTVLRHWFVHFNPLYLLSAFCVLTGVFLVNRSLDLLPADAFDGPRLALFAVMQAYEALIVAGAAFLVHRARVVRPAVLLVLLEAVLIFDGTLRLESLVFRGPLRFGVTLPWLAFLSLKVWGMAAALQVRLTRAHYARIVAAGAVLVGVVHLLAHPATNPLLVLQLAAWLGALVIGLLEVTGQTPISRLAVATYEERRRAERCTRGVFRILTGAYFVHVWSYILIGSSIDLAFPAAVAQLGTLFLRRALTHRRDAEAWRAGALLVCAALPNPAALPYAALVAAAAFAYRAWREGRSSLATGAALALYGALWIRDWPGWGHALPALVPASWPTLGLAIALALIAWRLRDRLACALLAAGAAYAAALAWPRVVPRGELARGVALVAAGFALLVAGLAVNWWLKIGGAPTGLGSKRAP